MDPCRRCPRCGAGLDADSPQQRYCSHACQVATSRSRAQQVRHFAAVREALNALDRGDDVPERLVCTHCQTPLKHGRIRADARYCNPTCRQHAYRTRQSHRRRDHGQPSQA